MAKPLEKLAQGGQCWCFIVSYFKATSNGAETALNGLFQPHIGL
jgi:hypothetical protein